ncbi:MAG: hypothetical protein IKA47_07440 [Oscillospiraceae bacterium]|nr:hypothetical protein [Oscillospiraceae bacterium]
MKHEKLNEALSELQDRHISEAARYKKKRPLRWMAPVAAVLALAILVSSLWRPQMSYTPPTAGNNTTFPTIDYNIQQKHLVAKAEYPKLAKNPEAMEGGNYNAWWEDQKAIHTQPEGYADSLADFWLALNQTLLTNTNKKNITCSPVNIYMALAMLAETTGGESRQQILDALGADTIESLRTQANQVWQGHYNDDGLSTSILANSLWLQENYGYNPDIAALLAQNYYASVFRGDLGSQEMSEALRAWLDEQTGGLLREQIENVELNPNTVLALASTIYYQVQWIEEFKEEKNTDGTFHGANGDTTQIFMNRTLTYGPYYWGEHFGAVALNLEDGSRMWLFLPDEGVAPEEIVEEVHAFLQAHPYHYQSGYENQKDIRVNLSLPKFDICADMNLRDALEEMGITDIFDVNEADFTPILTQKDEGYVSDVKHAARVAVDEKGVTAAAFTLILRAGAAPPPVEEIDFVLDRPFLFCVESQDDLPLFTGIVNEP